MTRLDPTTRPEAEPSDRGVSPVIGVILMVAITVILAAVIGTLVLDLGDGVSTTPQASLQFQFNQSGDEVTVLHKGGDTLDSAYLNVTNESQDITPGSVPSELSAGTQFTVDVTGSDTITVVWNSPDGESTATLATWTRP